VDFDIDVTVTTTMLGSYAVKVVMLIYWVMMMSMIMTKSTITTNMVKRVMMYNNLLDTRSMYNMYENDIVDV
jgi:hypothetical protein